jgi:hypothetical protein
MSSKDGFVDLHHFHVVGGEGIVSQELLVAVPECHDGIGLNVLDGIDVLALGSLGGVRAPTGSGFLSLGGAVLLSRPTDGLLVGGPRLLPFEQARNIAP